MPDKIANLINRLGRSIHCRQFAQGLNPAQWESLRFLARANRYSRTPSALAEYLRTTKGTASQTLKSLESKGYVRRVPVPEETTWRIIWFMYCRAGVPITCGRGPASIEWS